MEFLMHDPRIKQMTSAEDIQQLLTKELASQMGIESEELDSTEPFESYGLNSAQALVVAGRVENHLGIKLSPVLLMYYPTIESLSQRLAEEVETSQSETIEL
jgi:acyl carrier protein